MRIPLIVCFALATACNGGGSAELTPNDTASTPTGTETGAPTTPGPSTGTPTGGTTTTPPPEFAMSAPEFFDSAGHPLEAECDFILPNAYSCSGFNPEILWENAPDGTVAFALIFDDPDAGDYPHWAIYNIPGTETGLAEAISGGGATGTPPAGSVELRNGAFQPGYFGSCPSSAHVYRWRLWALDSEITETFTGSASQQYADLADAAQSRSLGRANLCHIFG